MRLDDITRELLTTTAPLEDSMIVAGPVKPTLAQAREKHRDAEQARMVAPDDRVYWAHRRRELYWSAIANLLEAAEIVGPDNLPDVEVDFDKPFSLDRLEAWSLRVLAVASSAGLTFAELRTANTTRVHRWHDGNAEPWTGADWSNAMCGEAGEAANVVKKLRRHETGCSPESDPDSGELMVALADELADTICYLDLLAEHYGIDLAAAVIAKFNRVSENQGFPERLGVQHA